MALSPDQIASYSAANKSGFNYALPDGTVITTSVNPQYAATVDTRALLAGKAASPIPDDLLSLAKSMFTNPDQYVYDANTAVKNSPAALAQNPANATPAPTGHTAPLPTAPTSQSPSLTGGTPTGTPAAQTQPNPGAGTQSPTTAGTAAGAINYQKLPNETIDQYNARIAASGGPSAPTGTSTGAAGAIDTNYQMKPGETIDSYNARIAAYNASKPTTNPTGQVGQSGSMGSSQGTTGVSDPYAGLDPIQKQVKMYTDAYNALGLNTIKQQFDDYAKQQADLTDKMNEEIQNTQNNPWLSQGIVDKTIQRIKDKYATKLDTLTHLLTLTDSIYKQGQAQVDHLVSDANADIKATNDLAQKQIDAANALAKDNVVQSVGGRELLINKQTGKTVADLGPTTKTATTSFTLSPGSVRYDANGSIIADNPKPTSNTPSKSTAKGSQTSQQFVESTLSNQGLDYNTVLSSIPPGRMGVIDNKTGTIGTILPTEFDASKYTQL